MLAGLAAEGAEAVDLGVRSGDVRVDYPDLAREVGTAIRSGQAERGVLVCGSGVGASIAASKIPGIRAAICHDTYSAHQGVEHDDMNVLCLGSEVVGPSLAGELTDYMVDGYVATTASSTPSTSSIAPSASWCAAARSAGITCSGSTRATPI